MLPALAGVGAPWWRPDARGVIAGLTAGVRPAHIARAALEGIAWRVADIVAVVQETVPVQVLRVDGGLTRDPTLLAFQADAAGVTVQRGPVDATASGAARWPPSGPGCGARRSKSRSVFLRASASSLAADSQWRTEAHAAWRAFVERAVAL